MYWINYSILFTIIVLIAWFYYLLAAKLSIVDIPNQRSSHTKATIRGGGIIFPIAIVLWYLLFQGVYPWFLGGMLLIGLTSFLDDKYTLSYKVRLPVQFAAMALLAYQISDLPLHLGWWAVVLILGVGWVNTFNFMDGINGITTLYAATVCIGLVGANYLITFTQSTLLISLLIAAAVFGFFNLRKKALMFAGDVGSVSLAFALAFLLCQLIVKSETWYFILFFLVYGIDSVLTIVERLRAKENIFEAHRGHLYQLLANELGISHLKVSAIYAVVQLTVCALVLAGFYYQWPSVLFGLLLLLALTFYILIKRSVKQRIIHD
jgi:UDP-N-acetylmuramyl pentapeptide phosphotransferase/UDP-N-acetylglucosamine-1-phosphate transferase